MKTEQRFSPKYWVVHDKTTNDVFIDTAHKAKDISIHVFLQNHSYEYFGVVPDDELIGAFLLSEKLECILVELNIVNMGN